MDLPTHVRTMVKNGSECKATMQLTFSIASLLGAAEQSAIGQAFVSPAAGFIWMERVVILMFGVMTPVAKALTTGAVIAGFSEYIGSLTGVGYLGSIITLKIERNIARLCRDANILSIQEGTTVVVAVDVRVLTGSGRGSP